MTSKPWYTSKTIWANLLAVVAIILNAAVGVEFSAEEQAVVTTSVLAIVNIVLRVATSKPVRR